MGVIFISTMLTASYFLPIVYRAFFRAPPAATPEHLAHGEGPFPVVLALIITALGTLAMFFFPEMPFALSEALVGQEVAK